MPLINGRKYACEPCVRGHRATTCAHTDRILVEVRKPGRPLESCGHAFATCNCGKLNELFTGDGIPSPAPLVNTQGQPHSEETSGVITTPIPIAPHPVPSKPEIRTLEGGAKEGSRRKKKNQHRSSSSKPYRDTSREKIYLAQGSTPNTEFVSSSSSFPQNVAMTGPPIYQTTTVPLPIFSPYGIMPPIPPLNQAPVPSMDSVGSQGVPYPERYRSESHMSHVEDGVRAPRIHSQGEGEWPGPEEVHERVQADAARENHLVEERD